MKKLLSLLLVLTIAVGSVMLVPLTSAAAETDEGEPAMTVPQIRIVTEDGNGTSLQKADGYVNASVTITDIDGSVLSDSALVKVRGNTTAMTAIPKKGYAFKFGKKKEFLGMGKGKKWVLLANTFDPTLLRNFIANELAHRLGLPYTSEQRFVELWLDGSFRGLYTLMEPVQEGKDRVDIDIESNSGKKDFLLEYERLLDEEDVTYLTTNGLRFAVKEPEEPDEDQLAYIQGVMDDIVGTMKNGTREEIESKIDVESFVLYYLLNEFYKTYDFDTSSVYYFYQDGKLFAGPAWDYDLSTGNTTLTQTRGKAAHYPDGIYANKQIYSILCKHEWFRQEVRAAFIEHYAYLCGIIAPGGLIDQLTETYSGPISRNYSEAGWKAGRQWVNIQHTPLPTYEENVEYLRAWFSDRIDWLADYYHIFTEYYLLGDADGDQRVTVLDATRIQRLLADLITDDDGGIVLRGNVRGSLLDILDATLIQRWLAGFDIDARIGDPVEFTPA